MKKRLVVGISGASGVIYGIRLMEILSQIETLETHLIISPAAALNISIETESSVEEVQNYADYVYNNDDLAAAISSGSFLTDGMIIVPCSIKSISGIAHSYNDNLMTRAADVALKEGRKLVLVPRETPLRKGHLNLMLQLADSGAILLPPFPAFYHRPLSIQDIIDHTVGKILDQLHIHHDLYRRWSGNISE